MSEVRRSHDFASRRPSIRMWPKIAASTMSPPARPITVGASPNASHTHSGASGRSSVMISAACAAGTRAMPSVVRIRPAPYCVNPNSANSPTSRQLMA